MVTKVSLGPCNKDDTSKADFPLTSSPLTAKTSSPCQKKLLMSGNISSINQSTTHVYRAIKSTLQIDSSN